MSPGEELWSHFNAISNYQQQVICQFDDIKADEDDCHFFAGQEFQARDISRKMGTLPQGDRRGPYEGKGRF